MGPKSVLTLTLCVLLGVPAVAGASMTDLYGLWTGTWYVDQKIDSKGKPFGKPPFSSVDVELSLVPYDSAKSSYGILSYGGLPAGDVVALALNGTNVSITVNYAPYCGGTFPNDPTYYALITGSLSGGKITGNYDEATPPPGWIGWRGPCEMTYYQGKIPEPATICLAAMGALLLVRRRRAWAQE